MKNLKQKIPHHTGKSHHFSEKCKKDFINEYRSNLIDEKNYYWRYLWDVNGRLIKEFI